MSQKRIVFSTNTPNDQGFRIPNDVLDFSRYEKNPVLLSQHNWETLPLGHMTDIDFNNGEWTGIPVFHGITEESRIASDLWNAGYLKACSIGGFKVLKTTGKTTRDKDGNSVPEIWTDSDGLAVATHFEIYEISMVTIPSNMDAVQKQTFLTANQELLNAKCYDDINIKALEKELTTLSTKLKTMEDQELEAAKLKAENDKVEAELKEAKLAADKSKADKLQAEKDRSAKLKSEKEKADKEKAEKDKDLPKPIEEAVDDEKKSGLAALFSGLATLFGIPGTTEKPNINVLTASTVKEVTCNTPDYVVENPDKAKDDLFKKLQEKEGKMKAREQAQEALKVATMKASSLMTTALEAKEKAEKPEASDEDKEEFLKAKKEADEAVELCDKMESDMDGMDDSDEMKAEKKKKKEKEELAAKLAAQKVRPYSLTELKEQGVKLAAKPSLSNINMIDRLPKSMAALKADVNGKKIFDRVTRREEDLQPQEIAAYMSALSGEKKFKNVIDKTRVILDIKQKDLAPSSRQGDTVGKIVDRLNGGNWKTQGGQLGSSGMTTLTATDTFLASPDLFAMDFLDLAIFNLFPDTSWKNDIPIFGATTNGGFENNTGLIWANIAANPTIYMGTQPVNPTPYTYGDTAVSLNLTPFWMNPILWQPLTMAQFRYDQMGTGWAQSMAVLGTYIDDFLLYTLASAVPHASIVYSSGVVPNPNGGSSAVQQFQPGNADSAYSFYYNPAYSGPALNQPTLNDIITTQTVYVKQNFPLETKKPVMVMDPTTDLLISQTAQTQSLLTRWIEDNGSESLGFKRTKFNVRSRVVAFNPLTAQVLSPFSIIPSAATSANLGFIPDEIGIGISNLDVFMVQSPINYGYVMSADVRMGITPLRKNGFGTTLLAYGPGTIS